MLSSRHAWLLHLSSQQLWLHKTFSRSVDTPARGTSWTQWVGQKCQRTRTWRWDGEVLEVLEEGEQNLQSGMIKIHCMHDETVNDQDTLYPQWNCQWRNERQSLKENCKCCDKKSCQYKDDHESHLENRVLRGKDRRYKTSRRTLGLDQTVHSRRSLNQTALRFIQASHSQKGRRKLQAESPGTSGHLPFSAV